MNKIFKTRFKNWIELEAAIASLPTALEAGDAFEEFSSFYLEYHGAKYQLEQLNFPRVSGSPFDSKTRQRLHLGSRDNGVDGVLIDQLGRFVAIQSKFRSATGNLTYRELSTFWSDAENADFRLVITNCESITSVSERRRGHLEVIRTDLLDLSEDFFDALSARASQRAVGRPSRKEPRPYQEQALKDVVSGFQVTQRGKLIAACGIGKTLISLWVHERLQARLTVFVAPSLYLVRQTITEWAEQSERAFTYLAICSDASVANDTEYDDAVASTSDVPTTTDIESVTKFLRTDLPTDKVVFVTYQSFDVLAKAAKGVRALKIDLMILDESHKTAGVSDGTGFQACLSDDVLRADRRLFMTATERIYSARTKRAARNDDIPLMSMDDLSVYGQKFHQLTFSSAIAQGIISDYRVVVAVLRPSDVREIVENYGSIIDQDEGTSSGIQLTQHVVNSAIIRRLVDELGVTKVVSYHSAVQDAREFAHVVGSRATPAGQALVGLSVDGSMSAAGRNQIIREFERSQIAVLSNARCLIEGVDVPIIDGVLFATPKTSLIDIVQAMGRALRKPADSQKEMSYVVIPVLLESEELDVSNTEFDRLFDVIQALRDQDEGVASTIDQLNLAATTGGAPRTIRPPRFVLPLLPGVLDVVKFESELALRIADVNRNPSTLSSTSSQLGAGERTSPLVRGIRTIGDYTPQKFRESLIDPTIGRFSNEDKVLTRSQIRINNNNVAHSVRLGVVSDEVGKYRLSPLGKKYLSGEISFEDLFRNQILLYRDPRYAEQDVYPYRLLVDFLVQQRSIDYWDFLFGFYGIDVTGERNEEIGRAIERCGRLVNLKVNRLLAGENSKRHVYDLLIDEIGLAFSFNDVWTDRTTTGNQFRYFLRHIEMFEDALLVEGAGTGLSVTVLDTGEHRLRTLMNHSGEYLEASLYGTAWWVFE